MSLLIEFLCDMFIKVNQIYEIWVRPRTYSHTNWDKGMVLSLFGMKANLGQIFTQNSIQPSQQTHQKQKPFTFNRN